MRMVQLAPTVDYPKGFMGLEDKIMMIERLSQLRIIAKKEGIAQSYNDYSDLIAALLTSCEREVKALDILVHGLEDE